MKQMKTIKFPNDTETYEIVDETARNKLEEIEAGNSAVVATKEWVAEQLGVIENGTY